MPQFVLNTVFDNPAMTRSLHPGLVDNFNLADGTLDFTEDGKTWELISATGIGTPLWVRASGAAKLLSPSPSAFAVADGQVPDGVLTCTIRTKNDYANVILRFIDDRNYLQLQLNGGLGYKLRKVVGNVGTSLVATSTMPVNGDVIAVTLDGSAISMTRNGSALGSPATCTDHLTATKHGMFNASTDYTAAFESIEFVAAA